MIAKSHDDDGSVVDASSVALVANIDGSLDLLVPLGETAQMPRCQFFLAAVAFRSTDQEWVNEQIEFIVEVRRQLDAAATLGPVTATWHNEE